jgi:ABC-type branched-subunit amino acid transport system substrate-binding protein
MKNLPRPRTFARGFLLALLFAILAVVPFGCNLGSSSDAHRIGHLAPRSGPESAAGIRLGEAVAMVVESFNHDESGGIDRRQLSVIHADSGPSLDGFAFQATRLLAVNRVEALLGATNTEQLAKCVGPVQTNEVVIVSPSSALVGTPSRLIWAVGLPSPVRGKWLARHAAEKKITDISIVVDQTNPTFAAIRDGFEAEFRHPDRHISSEWNWAAIKDVATFAKTVVATKPKAILFCGRAADLLTFRAAFRAASTEVIPILFGGEEEEPILRQEPQSSEGVVFVSAFTPLDASEKVKSFCNDFRGRCNQLPEATDALSADAARILFAAALKAQTFKATGVAATSLIGKLTKLEIDLPTGSFAFSDDGVAQRTAYILQIESGQVRLLKTCGPEKQ